MVLSQSLKDLLPHCGLTNKQNTEDVYNRQFGEQPRRNYKLFALETYLKSRANKHIIQLFK